MPILNEINLTPVPTQASKLGVGRLLNINPRSQIQKVSERIVKRMNVKTTSSPVRTQFLSSIQAKLIQPGGGLNILSWREKKGALEILFDSSLNVEFPSSFIEDWLQWAGENWNSRSGLSRIAATYIRNFDDRSTEIMKLGDWLKPRSNLIKYQFGDWFRSFHLDNGSSAIKEIATGLNHGDTSFIDMIVSEPRINAIFRGSGLMVSLFFYFGNMCESNPSMRGNQSIQLLTNLLSGSGLLGARGTLSSRESASDSMVSGLVGWAKFCSDDTSIGLALEIILSLAGDPRRSRKNWGNIRQDICNQVEYWLTARTIDNLFRVIDDLKTDRQDMTEARLKFWRSYIPWIKKAYLICGSRAEVVAERLKEPYGSFYGAKGDQCGVLMEMVGPQGDRLVILEVNKNGATYVWRGKSYKKPDFFLNRYDRRTFVDSNDMHLSHYPGWEKNFEREIERETGIRRPVGRYHRD